MMLNTRLALIQVRVKEVQHRLSETKRRGETIGTDIDLAFGQLMEEIDTLTIELVDVTSELAKARVAVAFGDLFPADGGGRRASAHRCHQKALRADLSEFAVEED
jgi:hypothetical protein